jgi:ankyrin repeat protein
MTPLELAIQEGREKIAIRLMKLGSKYDELTLYLSSMYRRSRIVNELLNRNIPYARIFDHGNTALHASLQFWFDKAKYQADSNRNIEGAISTINVYLSHGVDINSKDGNGRTLLHIALGANSMMQASNLIKDIEVIKFMIANQSNVNIKDNKGNTPLHYLVSQLNNERSQSAWEGNMLPLLELIVPKMKDIDSKNKRSLTPLQIAVQNNNIRTAEYLIASGANATASYIPGKFEQASEGLNIQDQINLIKQGEWWNYPMK